LKRLQLSTAHSETGKEYQTYWPASANENVTVSLHVVPEALSAGSCIAKRTGFLPVPHASPAAATADEQSCCMDGGISLGGGRLYYFIVHRAGRTQPSVQPSLAGIVRQLGDFNVASQ